MKTVLTRLLLITLLSVSLAFLGGCGSKSLDAYQPKAGDNMPEGKSLADGARTPGSIYEENMGPDQEGLDAGSGQNGFDVNAEQNTDAYKRKYGRSSKEMQPVYFNFDQATIRNDQISRMEANAQHLKDNAASNVVIEGNCDEQGTNEYNLALGERRAINAKRYLVELGVDEFRIRTISYGEERPLFSGASEDDYAQNRRDDFILE
jgi:peptidoglycan-associated lipoprotein